MIRKWIVGVGGVVLGCSCALLGACESRTDDDDASTGTGGDGTGGDGTGGDGTGAGLGEGGVPNIDLPPTGGMGGDGTGGETVVDGDCTPGALDCSGYSPTECSPEGLWTTLEECSGTCDAGICDDRRWAPEGTRGFTPGQISHPQFQVVDNVPYMAFLQVDGEEVSIVVQRLGAQGWESLGPALEPIGMVYQLSLTMIGTTPYVGYADSGNNGRAYVARLSDGAWESVGASPVGTQYFDSPSISSSGGIAHLAVTESVSGSYHGRLLRLEGDAWQPVGSSAFSEASPGELNLTFESTTPYVAYVEPFDGTKSRIFVKRYQEENWVDVGTQPVFTNGEYAQAFLQFHMVGTVPYIGFTDLSTGSAHPRLMRYVVNQWETVGGDAIASTMSAGVRILFPGGIPHIAHNSIFNKTTVSVLNDGAWVTLGRPDLAEGPLLGGFVINNEPRIVVGEAELSNRPTVFTHE